MIPKSTSAFLFMALAFPVFGQVYVPPAEDRTPSRPTDTVVRSQPSGPASAPGGSDGLLGNEVGFFDPTNDTISWNGSTWAAANARVFASRFEKFLNEPENESEEAIDYRKTIDEILAYLSPHRRGGPAFAEAVALLPRASIYPGDARLCESLSNAIYTAVLSNKDVSRTKKLINAMEKEKQKAIRDADWKARTERSSSIGNTRPAGEGQAAPPEPNREVGRGAASLRYAEHLRRITEIEASKKTKEVESKVKSELAKVQYQALMVQFFVQRRFQHVLMASRFYNEIWGDGDGTLYLDEKSEINKMFSETLGVSPTVSTLDSLANEAIRDIDKGVEVFLFLVERKELESASKRLSEAYIVGEFMPSIDTLARSEKRKVLQFVRDSNTLLNAITMKDYSKASEQIKVLQDQAGDFDPTKAEAAIATYTRASNMSIMMAKSHFASGDNEKAQEEVRKAMELWPRNPKLEEFDQLLEAGTIQVQTRNDFDRLFAEQNYREVFKRQHEFGAAVKDDPKRSEMFTQVIGNITEIKTAIESAKGLTRMGHSYAAWEELLNVHERFPDDPVLSQFRTELASEVADFTIALKKAAEHEERGSLGSALAWYYKARHLHPTSNNAEEGIARISDKVLE